VVILEQELTEETEFSFPSPLSPFAPVELRGSSVRAGKNKAMHTIGQFHLMEVDEQPNLSRCTSMATAMMLSVNPDAFSNNGCIRS
jgi:hypothetical protein